jgi:hypothetical protein
MPRRRAFGGFPGRGHRALRDAGILVSASCGGGVELPVLVDPGPISSARTAIVPTTRAMEADLIRSRGGLRNL